MQDNYPQEFDEQYINEAWMKMRQLLDKEMPVQPRRRAAWWVWLLAGLFLIALGSGGTYLFYHKADHPEKPSSSSPTARLEHPAEGQLPAPRKGLSAIQPGQDQKVEVQPPALNTNPEPSDTKAATPKALASADSTPAPDEPAFPKSNKGQAKPPESSLTGSGSDKQEGKTGLANQGSQTEKGRVLLNPFPTLQPGNSNRAVAQPGKTEEVQFLPPGYKKPRAFRLAVEGGAYLLGQSAPDGLGAGLAIEFMPGGKRLYLRSGAFYRSYQPQAAMASQDFQLELANRTSLLSARSSVATARYAQIPLAGGLRLTPRLAVEAGLQAGILLSSQAVSEWSLTNQSSSSGDPMPENNTIYEFESDTGRGKLRATSLDIIAGLAYRPGLRTTLRLSYQYGLYNILDSPSDEAYIRGVQISAAYYFLY